MTENFNWTFKRERKDRLNFGVDLATSLTLRIYVPQRSKAMLGGLTLTDGFHCQGLGLPAKVHAITQDGSDLI